MARYSDSEEEKRSRKKKKRSSRSRSRSAESHASHASKHKKRKKAKKVARRSPSSSPERPSRRASPHRRSRTPSPKHSSRMASPHHRSRTPSPHRRRSRSAERRRRSRSSSPRRRRSRSGSRSRSKRGREMVLEPSKLKELEAEAARLDPCAEIPGFQLKSPAEQAEIRLQMALSAARQADEKLKQQGVIGNSTASSTAAGSTGLDDLAARSRTMQTLEIEDFSPASFKSSRDARGVTSSDAAHESAMFGGDVKLLPTPPPTALNMSDPAALMAPSLVKPEAERMEKWRLTLIRLRQEQLERTK